MNYRCETDLAAIKNYLQNATVVAFDFETAPLLQYRDDPRAALDAHRACIVGISLSTSEGSAIYIPLEHFDGGNADSDQYFFQLFDPFDCHDTLPQNKNPLPAHRRFESG